MTSENFEFSDISDQKYNSETKLTMENKKNSGGCFISTTVGVFMFVLAVGLAVGVGVIVYFAADGRDIVCQCDNVGGETVTSGAIRDKCKELAGKGDEEVCNQCPASTKTTLSPGEVTLTPAPTTKPPKVTDVRLPKSVIPIHYDVTLQPFMYSDKPEEFNFKGEVSIIVECLEATDNVTVHIKILTLTPGTLKFEPVTSMGAADPRLLNHEFDDDREFLILRLSKNMQVKKRYKISMTYTSPLEPTLKGLYLSSYERDGKKVYLASTQFQPTDARRTFPCFDEPAIKATFNITLVRKSDLISISNMPIVAQSAPMMEDGIEYVADVYQRTPKMPTYLLAFIICDFEFTQATAKSNITDTEVEYRAFSRPEVKNSTLYALDVGAKVLPYFEAFFNTTYPLPKQDMIAIPDFAAGAMENWGLITYRETAMLYEPGVSTADNKERVAIVVSHELAHQWFGDLVTPSWWDDLWLNEGFATFVEYIGVDYVHPDWKVWENFAINELQKVLTDDALATSHPVYVPVGHPDEINEIFDSISYSKGGSIIRMMRHFLGFETFRKGMERYLHERAFGAAFHDDLWQALTQQAMADGKNFNVKEIMDTWTLQMNYPVVTVTRDFNNLNNVHVVQQRYLVDPSAQDPGWFEAPFGYKWTIPITVTSSKNPNFKTTDAHIHWLDKTEDSKNIPIGADNLPESSDRDGWILANAEQNGFYRVNYQLGNWNNLIKQLENNHEVIPVINRAQIINDAWNLAKPGMLDMTVALNTANYLDKELSYVPWTAASRELSYVGRMLKSTATFGLYSKFMKEKAEDPFKHYGFNNNETTPHMEIMSRNTIARRACISGIKDCIDQAKQKYKEWMDNPEENKIDANLKNLVYCTAVSNGGWDEWQFAMKMYKKSLVASEQDLLRRAMTCTGKQWILSHYLNLILIPNSPIRKQDALNVIGDIGTGPGQYVAWQFYRENFDRLSNDFSASFFSWSRVIKYLTQSFNTQFQVEELRRFMELKKDKLGTAKRAFEQAIETMQGNIKWMERHYPVVKAWFEEKYPDSSIM